MARVVKYLCVQLFTRKSRELPDPKKGKRMSKVLSRFIADESGATAIEYGLIAAGISVAIISIVQGVGSKLVTTFTSVQGALGK